VRIVRFQLAVVNTQLLGVTLVKEPKSSLSDGSPTYQEGYLKGYQSQMGTGATCPSIPATPSIPAGKTEYEVGPEMGKARGRRRKSF
jgi:hypothetical protein